MGHTNRAPFPYYGGKQQLCDLIVSLLPKHTTYVEVFGGAAAVLFAKSPSKVEIYNDLESGVVNFFRVLRDPDMSKHLQHLLDLTPFAREELFACRRSWADQTDPVEKARQWFTLAQTSFAGRINSDTGFRFTKGASHSPVSSYRTAIDLLPLFSRRLRNVIVEQLDFRKILMMYDAPGVCFYCDPPYVLSTRRREGYVMEMSDSDHQALLELVTSRQGSVVLSGYDTPLYRKALAGWTLIQVTGFTSAAGRTRRAGLVGAGSVSRREDMRRTECIWISPNAVRQPALFEHSA